MRYLTAALVLAATLALNGCGRKSPEDVAISPAPVPAVQAPAAAEPAVAEPAGAANADLAPGAGNDLAEETPAPVDMPIAGEAAPAPDAQPAKPPVKSPEPVVVRRLSPEPPPGKRPGPKPKPKAPPKPVKPTRWPIPDGPLTDEKYIAISAKYTAAVVATPAKERSETSDIALLKDVLKEAHVPFEDYKDYTIKLAEDPERSTRVGERIVGLLQANGVMILSDEAGVPAHDLKLRGTVEGEKEGR